MSGCAFNVSYVNKVPAAFTPIAGHAKNFMLLQDVTVHLGTGFPTRLKDGTRWHQVGVTTYGAVFTTPDQVVTVEASDVYEAQVILSNQCITGFYLPVEKEVAPVSKPIYVQIQTLNNP